MRPLIRSEMGSEDVVEVIKDVNILIFLWFNIYSHNLNTKAKTLRIADNTHVLSTKFDEIYPANST